MEEKKFKIGDLIWNIYTPKNIKYFNGLCPNRYGWVAYIEKNGVCENGSHKQLFVLSGDDDGSVTYNRILTVEQFNGLKYFWPKIEKMGLLIKAGQFGIWPLEDSYIMFDVIYTIDDYYFAKYMEVDKKELIGVCKNKELIGKQAMGMYANLVANESDWIVSEKIIIENLFQKPKIENIGGVEVLINPIAKVYASKELLKENLPFI